MKCIGGKILLLVAGILLIFLTACVPHHVPLRGLPGVPLPPLPGRHLPGVAGIPVVPPVPFIPSPGAVLRSLPHGHVPVVHHGHRYFFHDGIYYARGHRGYTRILPPPGLVMVHLPVGATRVVVSHRPYYYYNDVYYEEVNAGGYVVVADPYAAGELVSPGETIRITAGTLNVRSGPGSEHQVVEQVHAHERLIVEASAPGWYCVRLSNGRDGWVKREYTRAVR